MRRHFDMGAILKKTTVGSCIRRRELVTSLFKRLSQTVKALYADYSDRVK